MVAKKTDGDEKVVQESHPAPIPRSVQIASRGIRTDVDAANFFSALTSDIMTEEVKVKTANAACNSMGKLLKVVDMRLKHGSPTEANERPLLRLADPDGDGEIDFRRKQLLEELAALDAAKQKLA